MRRGNVPGTPAPRRIALWPRPTTSSPTTKLPRTSAGTPFRTSRTTRGATEGRAPAYSDMKIATRMGTGTAGVGVHAHGVLTDA